MRVHIIRSGPVVGLLLEVSPDYAQSISGQVTEVTCPVMGRAQHELTPSKRQKTGPDEWGTHKLDCLDIPSMSNHTRSAANRSVCITVHNDVIKWKYFPRYWHFVWAIHRSPVNSPHKGQWHGASILFLFDLRLNKWFSKQSSRCWFETPSRSLWRHCNVITQRCYKTGYVIKHRSNTEWPYLTF